MGTFLADLKYGARLLVRTPAVSLIAVLTLALGIGANSALFSVVHAVVMSPLPYPHADRLVELYTQFPTLKLDVIGRARHGSAPSTRRRSPRCWR